MGSPQKTKQNRRDTKNTQKKKKIKPKLPIVATVRQPKTFVKNTTITNAPPSAIDGNTTSVRAQQHLGGDGEIQREEKKGKVQKHTHTEDPVEIYENFLDFCD